MSCPNGALQEAPYAVREPRRPCRLAPSRLISVKPETVPHVQRWGFRRGSVPHGGIRQARTGPLRMVHDPRRPRGSRRSRRRPGAHPPTAGAPVPAFDGRHVAVALGSDRPRLAAAARNDAVETAVRHRLWRPGRICRSRGGFRFRRDRGRRGRLPRCAWVTSNCPLLDHRAVRSPRGVDPAADLRRILPRMTKPSPGTRRSWTPPCPTASTRARGQRPRRSRGGRTRSRAAPDTRSRNQTGVVDRLLQVIHTYHVGGFRLNGSRAGNIYLPLGRADSEGGRINIEDGNLRWRGSGIAEGQAPGSHQGSRAVLTADPRRLTAQCGVARAEPPPRAPAAQTRSGTDQGCVDQMLGKDPRLQFAGPDHL